MDTVPKTEIDTENTSKRVVQEIVGATRDLIGNKIADTIISVGKTKSNEKEDETNKREEVSIKLINDLRLIQILYKNRIPKYLKLDTKI